MLPSSPKSSSVHILGPHAGLWLPPGALGISHMLDAGGCSYSLWGRNPDSHKNMVQWSDISIWNWPGPDNASSDFACLFLPTPSPVVFFSLSFSALYNSPPGRALASLHPGETWTRGDAGTSCVNSLWGDPPSSSCSLKDGSDKKTGLVQHPSEPLKGHGILQAGAKCLETRCRCGFDSEEGMGGELTEGKTHPSSISTIRRRMMSPDTQHCHKAVQLFRWGQGFPLSRHTASPTVAQHDQCVTGTAERGESKGRVAWWLGHCQGLGGRIWMGSGFPDPHGFSCLFNPTTS